jgi:heterodisulfide reductase subunit B
MKTYAYYPGCSLEKMSVGYDLSAIEAGRRLGLDLRELEDWNCCGATPYSHIDELLATVLCARNLAIAEKDDLDIVAPCSGCYKNLYFTRDHLKEDPMLAEHINDALKEDDLDFKGNIRVRHLLEVFAEDVGLDEVRKRVTRPLNGLKVAPYYGCQLVRPRKADEDVEQPTIFENLLAAIGAKPVDFPMRLRCCGGSLIVTNRKAALSLVRNLLQNAADAGADVIATICPLCQINVECYQTQINKEFGTEFSIPVMFFSQLLGLALGASARKLGIGREFVSPDPVLTRCRNGEAVPVGRT